jgi:hypothetical protein
VNEAAEHLMDGGFSFRDLATEISISNWCSEVPRSVLGCGRANQPRRF